MTVLAVAESNDVLRAALAYAERGWRVVPIRPGEKRPMIDAWQTAATTDAALIEQWWRRWPTHGVGIATGRESGIFVLDVDVHHAAGKFGDESLADLEATYGRLPSTVEDLTGSGGRHLFFEYPSNMVVTNSAGRLGPWLDIRGEGGQVLAPPTRHPNGQRYEWEASSSPLDGVVPVAAPDWFLRLLTEAPTHEPRRERVDYTGDPRPGDRFAAAVTWPDLLRADGATFIDSRIDRKTGSTYEVWARPGVDDHGGATLYFGGSDVLKVFTSNWPGLVAGETYTRFGYFVSTRYAGDFSRAAGELAGRQGAEEVERWALMASVPLSARSDDPGGPDGLPVPVDWPRFWSVPATADWLIEPLIPTARHVVLYAPAKMGKSLLALEVAAAAASGRAVLGQAPQEPVEVAYFDFEMTEDDLRERLTDMGYGVDSDLVHLHYYSLPTMPPLDTKEGGDTIEAIVRRDGARLVVIDTMARVVAGEENSADTYRWFDMHTSLRMKALGVAVLRLDHAGKDPTKGQRGSSEKVGYADVVWNLTVDDDGHGTLKATHRRIGWVAEVINFERVDDPNLAHMLRVAAMPSTKVLHVVDDLDRLNVPLTATLDECAEALREAGRPAGRPKISEAQRHRRTAGTALGTDFQERRRGQGRNVESETTRDQPELRAELRGTDTPAPVGNRAYLSRGTPGPDVPDDDSLF